MAERTKSNIDDSYEMSNGNLRMEYASFIGINDCHLLVYKTLFFFYLWVNGNDISIFRFLNK